MKKDSWVRVAARVAVGYCVVSVVLGVVLAELSVHLPRSPLRDVAAYRARVGAEFHAAMQDVAIMAADGTAQHGWFVQPAGGNGHTVILLHGLSQNRQRMAGYGDLFLRHGYSVLMLDERGHGESGGVSTYGILEREDVRRWVEWLRGRGPGCAYLLGESLGAAVALQAEAVTPGLCGVVAESAYSHYIGTSDERLGLFTQLGTGFWKTAGAPAVWFSVAYTRVLYGVYLPDAEPLTAVRASHVPTLLIAGTADRLVLMQHSEELESACAEHCSLWVVPGAGHGEAIFVAPEEFERRVVGWFDRHDAPGR